jgi:hypothetical protein
MSKQTPRASKGERPETPAPEFHYRGLYRAERIPACAISLGDLKRLYIDLSEKTREALERQLGSFQGQPGQSTKELEEIKAEVKNIGGMSVVILGGRGERLLSNTTNPFEGQDLPDVVTNITFDSAAALQTYDVTAPNRFRLVLDFTEPPSFSTYDPWNQRTPNNSSIEVQGPDTTWVSGVYEYVISFFRARKKRRTWLHTETAFLLLNWLIGFPAALWIVYRIDSQFVSAFGKMHGALRGAIYVYIVLLALLEFRVSVAAFRWIFPLVELEGARSKRVRGVVGTVLGGLLLALLYDVLKTLLWP